MYTTPQATELYFISCLNIGYLLTYLLPHNSSQAKMNS